MEPQRWLPVHVLRDWRQQHHHSHLQGLSSDQESYAESTDGWSSANCSTLPPPMNKIPADRYRAPLVPGDHLPPPGGSQPPPLSHPHTHRLAVQKDEWAKKLFGTGDRERTGAERSEKEKKRGGNVKEGEKKVCFKKVLKVLHLVKFWINRVILCNFIHFIYITKSVI